MPKVFVTNGKHNLNKICKFSSLGCQTFGNLEKSKQLNLFISLIAGQHLPWSTLTMVTRHQLEIPF